jgi:hypothetical protein
MREAHKQGRKKIGKIKKPITGMAIILTTGASSESCCVKKINGTPSPTKTISRG